MLEDFISHIKCCQATIVEYSSLRFNGFPSAPIRKGHFITTEKSYWERIKTVKIAQGQIKQIHDDGIVCRPYYTRPILQYL